MPNTNDHIKTLILENQIEEAIRLAGSMDGMMVLLQLALNQYQDFYIKGLISLEQLSLHRSGVAYRLLCYLNIYNQTAHSSPELPPANLSDPDSSEIQPLQNLILPIEKTLIQKQLDMQKPVTVSAPKIMTFYFLEQKERTLTEALACMEAFRRNGHRAFTEFLGALRASATELEELHSVLQASGFQQETLTQTSKNCADLCHKLRRGLSPSDLNNAEVRSAMDQVEVLLSRARRQIAAIKECAERFSES